MKPSLPFCSEREAVGGGCRGVWGAGVPLDTRLDKSPAPSPEAGSTGRSLGLTQPGSISPGWAAGLLGRAGPSLRLPGPAWLGELCKERRTCQRVTGQLPAGHHLGCAELESRAANGSLPRPAGRTAPSAPPRDGSGRREIEHPREPLPRYSQRAPAGMTDQCVSDLSCGRHYAEGFMCVVSFNLLFTYSHILSTFYITR